MSTSNRMPPHGPSWMQPATHALQKAHAVSPTALTSPTVEACTEAAEDPCKDSKDTIVQAFHWLGTYSSDQLKQLKSDLAKADKPDWTLELLKSVVSVSFTGAVSAIGDQLGTMVSRRLADQTQTGVVNFIKKGVSGALKKGVDTGVDEAVSALDKDHDPDPEQFIAAQETALTDLYVEAQKNFIHEGRHELATTAVANALEGVFDKQNMKKLAGAHYVSSRDAYLSCLAQQTLGVAEDGKTTNMAAQSKHGGDTHAPSLSGAFFGLDRGILSVRILLHDDVTQKPVAWDAVLNGVNATIRDQYRGASLASVKVPRQLVCSVRGDLPDFIVNVDENGTMFLEDGSSAAWLEARGQASDASPPSLAEQRQLGLRLLLQETQVTSIRGGGK